MARKPTSVPTAPESTLNLAEVKEGADALNTFALIEESKKEYGQGRDLVNQLLGQAQMASAFGNFSRTISASKLAIVKKNKLYQQLRGMATPNGSVLSGTWEDFCGLLGMSSDKADLDIANVRAFGEEALEQMQRVGLGYREMRQFRRLPLDAKTELIEAAKAGDTETLLELAEDLMAKHIKEKTGYEQELAAKDQRIAKHVATIAAYDDSADKLAVMPVHELVAGSAARALGVLQGELRDGFEKLVAHHKQHGQSAVDGREVMQGYVAQIQQTLNDLREAFVLGDTIGDGTPAWKKWAAANPIAG